MCSWCWSWKEPKHEASVIAGPRRAWQPRADLMEKFVHGSPESLHVVSKNSSKTRKVRSSPRTAFASCFLSKSMEPKWIIECSKDCNGRDVRANKLTTTQGRVFTHAIAFPSVALLVSAQSISPVIGSKQWPALNCSPSLPPSSPSHSSPGVASWRPSPIAVEVGMGSVAVAAGSFILTNCRTQTLAEGVKKHLAILLVTFLGWLSDPFKD